MPCPKKDTIVANARGKDLRILLSKALDDFAYTGVMRELMAATNLQVATITDSAPATLDNMPSLLAVGTPGNRSQQGGRSPIATHCAAIKRKRVTPPAAMVAETFPRGDINTSAVGSDAELPKVTSHNGIHTGEETRQCTSVKGHIG